MSFAHGSIFNAKEFKEFFIRLLNLGRRWTITSAANLFPATLKNRSNNNSEGKIIITFIPLLLAAENIRQT